MTITLCEDNMGTACNLSVLDGQGNVIGGLRSVTHHVSSSGQREISLELVLYHDSLTVLRRDPIPQPPEIIPQPSQGRRLEL